MVISYDDFLKNPKKIIDEVLVFLDLPEFKNFDFEVGIVHSYPQMDSKLRQELSNYFRPYNEQLEALLNRKFNWE